MLNADELSIGSSNSDNDSVSSATQNSTLKKADSLTNFIDHYDNKNAPNSTPNGDNVNDLFELYTNMNEERVDSSQFALTTPYCWNKRCALKWTLTILLTCILVFNLILIISQSSSAFILNNTSNSLYLSSTSSSNSLLLLSHSKSNKLSVAFANNVNHKSKRSINPPVNNLNQNYKNHKLNNFLLNTISSVYERAKHKITSFWNNHKHIKSNNNNNINIKQVQNSNFNPISRFALSSNSATKKQIVHDRNYLLESCLLPPITHNELNLAAVPKNKLISCNITAKKQSYCPSNYKCITKSSLQQNNNKKVTITNSSINNNGYICKAIAINCTDYNFCSAFIQEHATFYAVVQSNVTQPTSSTRSLYQLSTANATLQTQYLWKFNVISIPEWTVSVSLSLQALSLIIGTSLLVIYEIWVVHRKRLQQRNMSFSAFDNSREMLDFEEGTTTTGINKSVLVSIATNQQRTCSTLTPKEVRRCIGCFVGAIIFIVIFAVGGVVFWVFAQPTNLHDINTANCFGAGEARISADSFLHHQSSGEYSFEYNNSSSSSNTNSNHENNVFEVLLFLRKLTIWPLALGLLSSGLALIMYSAFTLTPLYRFFWNWKTRLLYPTIVICVVITLIVFLH